LMRLMSAVCRRRELDLTRLLIEYKANIHLADNEGRTALMYAEENHLPEVKPRSEMGSPPSWTKMH
jgi:hypothetical protein